MVADDSSPPADSPWPLTKPVRVGGIPRVVIVGRPNVGKSTLFNALAGRRVAIEDPMAGVTRDRVSFLLDQGSKSIELIDTGGIGMVDDAQLKNEVDEQIAMALDLADMVLFVVDAKTGCNSLDKDIARRLRRLSVPIRLVANKVEGGADEVGVAEAFTLGFGDPIRISSKERIGTAQLRDDLFEQVGEEAVVAMMPADVVQLAIVGRMNTGKSTLVNALVKEDRVIVSDVAGTTRDAVDVPFSRGGRRFIAIDTAGMRKRKTVSDSVEFYGQSRALRAIRRADVVLLLLDATREVGRIDRQIAGMVVETGVPVIAVVTKWDLAREVATPADYEAYLRGTIRGLAFAPITLISAPEGLNLDSTLKLAAELHDQAGLRVSTGELNRVLRSSYQTRKPKALRGRIGKIYYASQVETHPPTFVIFVNEPRLFDDGWRRFLVRRLQESLPFGEIPLRLRFLARGSSHS
jgi:GTP-binding protein